MIEVSLYSIPAGDFNSRVGKCVARNRFDKESFGAGINAFVKGFLKENMDKVSVKAGAAEIESVLNSGTAFTRADLSCINYQLSQIGFKFMIQNVADDEENAVGIPSGEIVEWNVIDKNYIQYDYPTATKVLPGVGSDVVKTLKSIVESQALFSGDKFGSLRNPFTSLLSQLENSQKISGTVSSTLVSKIYEILDACGIEIFCATSED